MQWQKGHYEPQERDQVFVPNVDYPCWRRAGRPGGRVRFDRHGRSGYICPCSALLALLLKNGKLHPSVSKRLGIKLSG